MVNLNRMLLNKKYNKIRKLHSEVIDSMVNYMYGKYDIDQKDRIVLNEIKDDIKNIALLLDSSNIDEAAVMADLYIYNNYKSIPSVTDIYLEKNKFRNIEKIEL